MRKSVCCGGETMKRITEEQVKNVAEMARLKLTDNEVEQFTKQLDDFLIFAEHIEELDTSNVEATTHVYAIRNVMREDEVQPSLERDQVLKNAPDHENGQIKVPSILE